MDQRDVVREGYDEIAEVYDEERSATSPELSDDGVPEFLERLDDGSRVLDAGCGSGRPVLELVDRHHDPVGLDISTSQIAMARERVPAARFAQGDLATLPFEDDSFDAIVSFYAIIHVPKEEHETVLSEFHRVLRPGGELLVSMGAIEEWEGHNDGWLDTDAAMEWSYYGPEKCREIVSEAGFEVDEEWIPEEESDGFAVFRATA